MAEETQDTAADSSQDAADRRRHRRYRFSAPVDITDLTSGQALRSVVKDLSQQGMYAATNAPFALGAMASVRIVKGEAAFAAVARVVFSRANTGMGLLFTKLDSDSLQTLGTWISEARESTWLATNRRRSQRVLMSVPLTISGKDARGNPFKEETESSAISAHGAAFLLSAPLSKGDPISLANKQTKAAAECFVAHVGTIEGDRAPVGVEFALPNPAFWHVAFPPNDWSLRHPDAKKTVKVGHE